MQTTTKKTYVRGINGFVDFWFYFSFLWLHLFFTDFHFLWLKNGSELKLTAAKQTITKEFNELFKRNSYSVQRRKKSIKTIQLARLATSLITFRWFSKWNERCVYLNAIFIAITYGLSLVFIWLKCCRIRMQLTNLSHSFIHLFPFRLLLFATKLSTTWVIEVVCPYLCLLYFRI